MRPSRPCTPLVPLAFLLVTGPIAGGTETVHVRRDAFGVASVEAVTAEGAYYGAGYAAAQDRLFQMCLRRVIVQGRLAEFLGPDSDPALFTGPTDHVGHHVRLDRASRLIGWRRHAQAEAAHLQTADPPLHGLLEAYCQGVNDWIDVVVADSQAPQPLGLMHPLFAETGIPVDPWTPADCVGAWDRFASLFQQMTGAKLLFANEAVNRADIDEFQGGEQQFLESKFGNLRCDDAAAVVQEPDVPQAIRDAMQTFADQHGIFPNAYCVGGPVDGVHFSHAWAVSGAASATGEALLIGEPRSPVAFPNVFYEWHMKCQEFDVRGFGPAGTPNLMIGSSSHVAWGASGLTIDQADLFRIQTSAAADWRYVLDGQLVDPLLVEAELILVKDLVPGPPSPAPVPITYVETHFGPLVTELVNPPSGGLAPDEQYALRALPISRPDLSSHAAFPAMYAAEDVTEFRLALAAMATPSANVVAADVEGNIMYVAAGAHPVRRPSTGATFLAGWAAVDGTSTGRDWITLLPHDLKPWVENPAAGHVLTANHSPIGSWYPIPRAFPITANGDNERSRRLREMLVAAESGGITAAEMLAMRADRQVPMFRDLVALGLHRQLRLGETLSSGATKTLTQLGPWYVAGALADDGHPGTPLAAQITGRLMPPDAPQSVVDEFGVGPSGLHAFLKATADPILQGLAVTLTADEKLFIDNALARAYADVQWKSGSSDPSQWETWYYGRFDLNHRYAWRTMIDRITVDPDAPPVDHATLGVFETATILSPSDQAGSQFVRLAPSGPVAEALCPIGASDDRRETSWDADLATWIAEGLRPSPGAPVSDEVLQYDQ